MAKKNQLSFEEKIKRLEEIVERLEDETVGIEESLKLFEEGMKLGKECKEFLKNIEMRINKIIEANDDEIVKEPIDDEIDENDIPF